MKKKYQFKQEHVGCSEKKLGMQNNFDLGHAVGRA